MDGVDMLKKWRDTCRNAQETQFSNYCRACDLYPVCPYYDAIIGDLNDERIEELASSIEEV